MVLATILLPPVSVHSFCNAAIYARISHALYVVQRGLNDKAWTDISCAYDGRSILKPALYVRPRDRLRRLSARSLHTPMLSHGSRLQRQSLGTAAQKRKRRKKKGVQYPTMAYPDRCRLHASSSRPDRSIGRSAGSRRDSSDFPRTRR